MIPGGRFLTWCVEQQGAVITAEMENFGPDGIEVRVWWNGRPYFADMYATEGLALMTSEQLRIGFRAGTVH